MLVCAVLAVLSQCKQIVLYSVYCTVYFRGAKQSSSTAHLHLVEHVRVDTDAREDDVREVDAVALVPIVAHKRASVWSLGEQLEKRCLLLSREVTRVGSGSRKGFKISNS